MPVSNALLDAGIASYREKRTGYTLNSGMMELREKVVRYHQTPHYPTTKNVVVTIGATGGLFAALMAVGDPGDEILYFDPSFTNYPTAMTLAGLVPKPIRLERDRSWALDLDAVAAAITPRTRALLLNSPSNPTGRIDSAAELKALVELTERSGIWLISDEVYRDIYFTPSAPPSVGTLTDRAIVIRALSKSASMTGFRVGYVLAPDAIATAVAAVHQFNVTCAPTLSQHLALVAMGDPERYLTELLPAFKRQRAAMVEAVDRDLGMPFASPQGGFFIFLDVRSLGMKSLELSERLLSEADVVTVPGIAFGENGEGFLRLSFVASEADIAEGIGRIKSFVQKLRA